MYSHRKYVLIQEVCTYTGSMYSYRKYVLRQEACIYTRSMYLHKKYVLRQEVCTYIRSMYLHRKYVLTVDVHNCNNVYLLLHGVEVGFFLEVRGRKTLEVEGAGSNTGET